MALDGITVAALAKELSGALTDAKINKITQTENDELYITVKPKTSGKPVKLLLSASASLPLCYLTDEARKGPSQAPTFCMVLRKHLQGGRITSVTQPGFERILRFAVEGTDEMGDRCTHTLIIELMGKHSNIILIDKDDVIVDSIRRVPLSVSSVRQVLPGRDYFVPSQDKEDPFCCDSRRFNLLIRGKGMESYKALYTTFQGFSPIWATELCHRASIDADKPAISLFDDEFARLFDEFDKSARDIADGNFSPTIVYRDGLPVEYAALPITLYENTKGSSTRTFDSISLVLSSFYSEKALIERMRQRSQDLRRLVSTALERNRRTLALQQRQMGDTNKREKYRLYGELLQAFGHEAKPKAKSFEVIDYHTQSPVTIPLDPQLSAQDNAKRYFERYRKLKRTMEALSEQTKRVEQDIEHLESVEEALSIARTEADLFEIREELRLLGYVKKAQKNGKRERIPQNEPLHFRTADDFGGIGPFDLYVGKNNIQNDKLTFHFATGGDWWFHAKKIPGSHVILRAGSLKQDEIPDRVYELAASLAAYYSKGRGQNVCEVDYVRKKEVKKPAGSHPGFVVYYTNYSMTVKPDISGLVQIE